MARKVFFSFHYKPDNWRASQVRNAGVIEGNSSVSDNDWESITRGGDENVKKWIADQLSGRSCTVVLIGSSTAGRKWINYEISKSWNDHKGVVGVYVNNLLDKDQKQSSKGGNPLASVPYGTDGAMLSRVAKAYDPPYSVSTNVYAFIRDNVAEWVEEAIRIRNNN
jgi:hypothetical protein